MKLLNLESNWLIKESLWSSSSDEASQVGIQKGLLLHKLSDRKTSKIYSVHLIMKLGIQIGVGKSLKVMKFQIFMFCKLVINLN